MSDGVAIDGTDVHVVHHRVGDDVVLGVLKSRHEVLQVRVIDAARDMFDAELRSCRRVNAYLVAPLGVTGGGRRTGNTLHCSFCGKSQHEVRKLVAGPKVFICSECAELVAEIIADK